MYICSYFIAQNTTNIQNMKKHIIAITILIAFFSFSSCKTKKHTKPATTTEQITTNSQKGNTTTENIVEQNKKLSSQIDFLNITNADAVINYYGNRMSVRMQIQVIKDKEICISVLPLLGIELYRVKITPEKFYIFDKLHKKYCDGQYQYLSALTGIDIQYKDIEALLTNRLFSLSKKQKIEEGYKTEVSDNKYILSSNEKLLDFEHKFDISPDYKIIATSIQNSQNQHISMSYQDFVVINKVLFPITVGVEAMLPNSSFDVSIEIKKIEINKEFEIKQLDFKKYSRTDCKKIF